jgi:hypothetical protein
MAINALTSRHPNFLADQGLWEKWRATYAGGEHFRDYYLERFSSRETDADFRRRKLLTPVPSFAKAAINDIRNAIFQRMRDIVRVGGSDTYMRAVSGQNGGVDLRGSSMSAFLGMKVLTDLLVMGKVGIYVDHPVVGETSTLADTVGVRPYIYSYRVEDIISYTQANAEAPSDFQTLLLRDRRTEYDEQTKLPTKEVERYRMLWLDQNTGLLNLQFHSEDGTPEDAPQVIPGLTRIPFVLLDIGDSLIKDVCDYQIALLNLVSSDVSYALTANFPFLTEQRDLRAGGGHLKPAANSDGTATAGGQGAADRDMKVGATQGRAYDLQAERPGFIHPSPEPLQASMALQKKLEEDIRKLVNLAVINLASRASAESKSIDNEGLNAGLSFIGLVLQSGERQIAEFWATYESVSPNSRKVATVAYPERYSLESDETRIEKSDKLAGLMAKIPGRTVKRELAKLITTVLLGGKISVDQMSAIHTEIDNAPYTTSDADTIIAAKDAGLVGEQTASIALGFDDDEYEIARKDHIERLKRIAETQGVLDITKPAARGVTDLDGDTQSGREERHDATDTTLSDSTKKPVRGEGRMRRKDAGDENE